MIWNLNPGQSGLRAQGPDALPRRGEGDPQKALSNPRPPWTPGIRDEIVEGREFERPGQ